MRRICSFTDFYCLVGFLCACRALGLSRINSCWRLSSAVKAQIQSVVNPIPSSNTKLNPWKDKIRRIRVIREPFERVRTEPKAKEHNNVVLSSRQTTKQLNNQTTKQPDNKITKHRQPNTNNLSLYIFIYWYFISQPNNQTRKYILPKNEKRSLSR